MDRESLDRLRFDRRLQGRRGWLPAGELDRHLASLPDVSGKLTTLAGEESAAADSASKDSATGSDSTGKAPQA